MVRLSQSLAEDLINPSVDKNHGLSSGGFVSSLKIQSNALLLPQPPWDKSIQHKHLHRLTAATTKRSPQKTLLAVLNPLSLALFMMNFSGLSPTTQYGITSDITTLGPPQSRPHNRNPGPYRCARINTRSTLNNDGRGM